MARSRLTTPVSHSTSPRARYVWAGGGSSTGFDGDRVVSRCGIAGVQVASAACEDDFPYLAGCGADQHVSSSRVGLPLTGHGLQRQARQYRSGQDPVDHRDPALGPQHRVIQRTRPGHRAPRRVGAAGARRSWHAQRPLTEAEAALAELHIFFFFNDTATTEIYTLSLHDALPI